MALGKTNYVSRLVSHEYDVKLEVLSQLIEKEFHAEKPTRGVVGFDVMLPRPVKVQTSVIVHLLLSIRCFSCSRFGLKERKTAETNGITVNFFKMSDITFGRTFKLSVGRNDFFDEIIFSEI